MRGEIFKHLQGPTISRNVREAGHAHSFGVAKTLFKSM